LEVEIEVKLERRNGERITSHSGYFTALNCDEAGFRRPILTGLAFKGILSDRGIFSNVTFSLIHSSVTDNVDTDTDDEELTEQDREDIIRHLRAKVRHAFFRAYEASPSTAALHGLQSKPVTNNATASSSSMFFDWKGEDHTFSKMKCNL